MDEFQGTLERDGTGQGFRQRSAAHRTAKTASLQKEHKVFGVDALKFFSRFRYGGKKPDFLIV